MDTKLKADISEHAVLVRLLERGYRVLKPVGDRLPYDLALDVAGRLVKIQVKRAWRRRAAYLVDSRRTKTNRRRMRRDRYDPGDFDFAIIHIPENQRFYIMPVDVFSSYRSEISFEASANPIRASRSRQFLEAWHLLTADDPGCPGR